MYYSSICLDWQKSREISVTTGDVPTDSSTGYLERLLLLLLLLLLCVWRPQHYTCALRREYVRGLDVKLHALRISALDGRCMISIGAGQHIWTLCDSIHGSGRWADPKICQGLVPSGKDPVSARNRKHVFRKPLLYNQNPREESVYIPPKIQ